jgi:uncharacterized SAM-binding protein YcdF (DUF218 family)
MFFYLSKIFGYFINPTAWVFMSLLAALILRRRKRRIFLVTALILFYVFSNNTLLNTFLAPWEKDGVVKVEKTYDVGIVLGGWIAEEDQRLDRVVFKKVPDRLFQAYRLYRQGKVKKLLISGGSGHYLYPHKKEALAIERYLLSIGVPEEDILTESQSRNTHENAVYTKEVLDNNPAINTSLLITSALHMRRAAACFRKVDLSFDEYSTDRIAPQDSHYNFENLFIPDVNSFYYWHLLIHEWIGYGVYAIRGYV